MRTSVKILILLAILSSLLSFVKFSPCEKTNWSTPGQYIHACYSDLPALYGARGLDEHKWAYAGSERAIEYPVITGVVMYATSWLVNSPIAYFNFNSFLLALLFIGLVLLVAYMRPENKYLLPIAPAMVASLYINWDLWAIISMVLAIFWFDRQEYLWSSLALGISISTKFMPVFLLLSIAFILWRRNEIKDLIKYIVITASTWLVVNLPVALTTPEGWWRFYKLNLERGSDWGSLWYALDLLGINLTNINFLALMVLLIGITTIAIYLFELKVSPSLASVGFILLATVMVASKVYSPQYVLWLTPLAIIALSHKNDLHAYWIWQSSEIIYHIAIWQHLALFTGARFGLPDGAYAFLTLARIAATLYFIAILARRNLRNSLTGGRNPHSRLFDFLFESSKSYP